jgi:hypothetical protein
VPKTLTISEIAEAHSKHLPRENRISGSERTPSTEAQEVFSGYLQGNKEKGN